MAQKKQFIPSSMGGIVRYMDEEKSRFRIKPSTVVFACVVVIIVLIILQILGRGRFA